MRMQPANTLTYINQISEQPASYQASVNIGA